MIDEPLDRRFGVVHFDDTDDPAAGWAAIAPHGTVRVSGPNELATDVIWWTNLNYDALFKRTELWRNPGLRQDGYLVVKPTDVLREWGHDPETVEKSYVCQLTSRVFDRIMKMSWSLLRDVNPKARISETFVHKTLREDLRPLLPEIDYPRGEAASVMKSGLAWEEFTATGAKAARGARWIMLRKPRVAYAMEMLQTPVPRGPFEFVSRRDLSNIAPHGDRVKWVVEAERPCVAEVAIHSIDPSIAPIYGFGAAINRDKRVARSWVAHPEFLTLSRFADMDIRNLWLGRETYGLVPEMAEVLKDFFKDPHTDRSWTAGVVAETIWRAIILGEDRAKAGAMRSDEEKAATSWPGYWIRAHDKSEMFQVSLRLGELGHTVLSYGIGWVRCAVQEEDVGQFIKDGMTLGLFPSLVDVPDGLIRKGQRVPWAGDERATFMAAMLAQKNQSVMWKIDTVPLYPSDQRSKVMQAAIGRKVETAS